MVENFSGRDRSKIQARTRFLILEALSEGPNHLAKIKKSIAPNLDNPINNTTLSRRLNHLCAEDLIVITLKSTAKPHTSYHITEEGSRTLEELQSTEHIF